MCVCVCVCVCCVWEVFGSPAYSSQIVKLYLIQIASDCGSCLTVQHYHEGIVMSCAKSFLLPFLVFVTLHVR